MGALLLALILFLALLLIPLGLPGTWVMVAAAIGYSALTHESIGWVTIAGVTILALVGELIEFSLAGRFARRYGGSRRAEWGAILGGMIGALMGLPVPVPFIGPMLGAFVGAFAGALLLELTKGTGIGGSTRVATGALLGRVAAAAAKVVIGLVLAVWILVAAVA